MKRPASRVIVSVGIAGLVMVAALASGVLSSTPLADGHKTLARLSPSPAERISSNSPAGSFEFSRDHGPLLGGQPVSILDAEALAGTHIPRPNSSLAGDSSIRGVFFEKVQNDEGVESWMVALDYASGLIVYVHPVAYEGKSFSDPATEYAQMAQGLNASLGSIASVATVLDGPALIIQRAPGGVPSVDLVSTDGFRIQLIADYAPDMDASVIVEIAGTIG
jgi:hypothetical protein